MEGECEETQKEGKRKIVLTFDDGPRSRVLMKLLPLLEKYQIKAIFFVIGKEVEKEPKWLLKIKEEGHIIANHTYSHKCLTKISQKKIEEEIKKTEEMIVKLIGEKPLYFRPPYLCTNQRVREIAKKLNYKVSEKVLDPRDWEIKSSEKLVSRVKKLIGSNKKDIYVFLFHEKLSTVEGLEKLLPEWEKEYIFTTEIP